MAVIGPFEVEVETRFKRLVRADVFLPAQSKGPFPVVFFAAPYIKALRKYPTHPSFPFRETGPFDLYLERGYAIVWADVPGSGRSEGEWLGWARAEGEALFDVIEWVARQTWSNGKIGMTGQSGFCWCAWNTARTRPPHLTTIVAYDGGVDMYREWMYHGGIPCVVFGPVWITTVMLRHQTQGHDIHDSDFYHWLNEIFARPLEDDWHRDRSPYWELDNIDIPVLSIGCWGKGPLHLPGNISGFQGVRGPKQLLLEYPADGAEAQRLFGREDFHEREVLPWFEHHLKDVANGVMERPRVRFFIQREGRYEFAEDWPPKDAEKSQFYLSGAKSGAVASLNDGSLEEKPPAVGPDRTSWSYPDPQWDVGPVTFGENGVPDPIARVITFTSAPFARDREFTGNGVLVLNASTDQTDLDVIAKLSIITKAGTSQRMTQGWLRASHRAEDPDRTSEMRPFHSHREIEPLEPGRVYELRVELIATSVVVRAGERLRLEISNADTLLTDGMYAHWYGLKMGTDTYHHTLRFPSRLMLHERKRRSPPEE